MRIQPVKHPSKLAGAFTLLELLVVISIIGVLASMMYPAIKSALEKANKAHAENTAYNLKSAISAYFTEYRRYPVDASIEDETHNIQTDHTLMDVLLGSDAEVGGDGLNQRKIAFYSGRQARPKGGGKYIKGITLDDQGGGELWDPYGNYYSVRLDLDSNSRVERPQWDRPARTRFIPETILVWSAGKDGDETEAVDNIKTW